MADIKAAVQNDSAHLLLVVVGAHLRAEVADRPLGYRLAELMRAWVERHGALLTIPLVPVVCSDLWYLNQEVLQKRPTISVGGPGVNVLSAYYADRLGSVISKGKQMVIQLDVEFVDLRVCLWGVNHELTVSALDYFVNKYLDSYLRAVATQVEPQES